MAILRRFSPKAQRLRLRAAREESNPLALSAGRSILRPSCAGSLRSLRNLVLVLLFAAAPGWAQSVQLTGANVAPLEGPAFGADTVLVYATGLQGTATTTATVTTDVNWIRPISTANFSTTMNIQNGPNRVSFVFAANSGAAQTGHIVVQPAGGGAAVTITVTQAAAGSVAAGPVPLVTSVAGPRGIDVDSQGNVYFVEVTGSQLYEWTAATQQLTTLSTKSAHNTFVDVALDGIGDVFALENTSDGKFGTQVEAIVGPFAQLPLLPGHLVFSSNDINYSFPAGLCVDAGGQNLNVTAVSVSNKCLMDQFGTVYELDSVDDAENIGSFASAPTNKQYKSPPVGRTFFPYVTTVDSCGNQMTGVSGSVYGLAKDGSGFIYFTDHGGLRLNKYDPTTPWFTCAPPNTIAPSYTSFTTKAALTVNAFNLAADLMGNVYLSEMPFSRVEEIPRAYVSAAGPINVGVQGGSQTLQIWPATQSLTGVFAPISSDTTWLTVTEAADGVVSFSVAPNSGQARTGILTVLGVPIQVAQAESQAPQAMTIIAGNNQMATVGTPFATNLLVKVTNQWGDPASGVTVNFVWPGQNIPVISDQRGYAAVNGVNAYAAGPNTVTASIQGTGLSQVFQLKGFQTGISVFSGSNQSVPTNQLFGTLQVQVLDANGQPLAQVPVTFSAPARGPSGIFAASNATSVTMVTGGNGIASSGALEANATAGSYVVTAAISGGGVSGVPSTCAFNLSNYAQLQLLVGDQTAIVNNLFQNKLGVKIVDSAGNPVAGAQVTFVSGDGKGAGAVFLDGTVSNSIATGGDGMARSQEMVATANTGTFTASALITLPNGGGTLNASWKLTNVQSAIFSGAVQDGVTTRTLTQPLIVKASPNATAGTMTFTVIPGPTGAGGSFNGQNPVTVNLDPQGYGISPLLTANSQPGQFTVNAYDGVTTVQGTVTAIPCISDRRLVAENSDNDPWGADLYSLRYLLMYACAGTNLDLSPIAGSTIQLKSRLRIDDDMTISGPSAGTVIIDGGNKTRLFFIGNGTVAMSNLTLQNGLAKGGASAYGGGGAGLGGAIFMQGGSLTLSNMTFTGNQAVGGSVGLGDLGLAGGGGFAGDVQHTAQGGGQGGPSGDLFGLPGFLHGAAGDAGAGGSGGGWNSGDFILSGGNGGFGAGGGGGMYAQKLNSSGNGGFGGGGGYGLFACSPIPSCGLYLAPGTGGYGAGNGYATNIVSQANFGGAGAGFGGAIFEYSGQLVLNGVEFNNNSALAGQLGGSGDGGDKTLDGQGKGGALFIYNGAVVLNNGATFGTQGPLNVAADAGQPGHGNSAAPYVNGATCPGQDTADVCGLFGNTSAVTITVPTGFTFFINGSGYSGTQTLNLPQAQYILTAPGPQAIDASSQLAFASWSDGGAATHTITVGPAGLSITGTFVTQYLLTTSAAGTGGSATPASGYFTAGSAVNVNALATSGSVFTSWTGAVAAAGSAATTVTMSGPQTVTANFVAATLVNVKVPTGVSFTLNGANYTGSQFVPLAPGQYTLSAEIPQSPTIGGRQFVFNSWSDGGALSHAITVGASAFSITGNFTTQYQLTATATSGGSVSSVTGFYDPATVVTLTATPNAGYVFHNWTGMVASPYLAATTVTMNQAATVTANFWLAPSACAVAPANLTAWWKGEGNTNDETTLFNGTGGSLGIGQGLIGNAFKFIRQQNSFVLLPAGAFPPQPGSGAFSFEAWFQTIANSGGVILGQQDSAANGTPQNGWSPAIYVGTDGNLYVEMFYSGTINQTVSSVPVNDNQWHHVAVTYDGNQEITYLDGANIGQSPSYGQVANGSPLSYQLGTGYTSSWPATNNGWYGFTGLIDEATTYSRALTGAEVLSIAQAGSYGKCDPVASFSPSTLSFPFVAEGQSASLNTKITNSGNTPLNISSIALDTNDTSFNVLTGNSGDCAAGTPVAAGASCSIRVQFAPRATGLLTGQVSIADNSLAGGGVQTVALSGTSVSAGTLILAASPSVTIQFNPVLLTATISGSPAPTGTVTFLDASTTLGTVALNSAGAATLKTTALAVGTHSLTAQYSGSKTYAAGTSNTATVTINPSAGVPQAVSVSPNVGSGALTQAFVAQYSDPNGPADLSTVRLLFNSTVNGAHACYVQYTPALNLLYLENDGGNGVSAGIAPGSQATVSNSQCTLIGSASNYLVSGNSGVLFVTITFKSTAPTNIYLYAASASGNSGWVQAGTWGVSAGPPTVVSVTPNAGTGASQTFSAVYSDPNGAADLATVRLLFNGTPNGAHACYLQYSPANNLLYLENDGNTGVSAGITPGSSATVSNSQCTLNEAGSSYNVSGNTATLNVALTFTSALPSNIYLYAGAASNSGWVQKGTWGVSAGAPTVVSVTPNAGSGLTQTFSAVYSDPNGAADLETVRLLFNGAVNGAHACYLQYSPADNLLYLENDGNTGLSAGIAPGSSATVSNSQCTLNAVGSSYNMSGNTATLNVALTFTSALPTNIYLYAGAASNSGWVQKGTWNSAGPPVVVSVTPSSGSGSYQVFSAVYSDPNGAADLSTVRLLINTTVNGAHACYVQYSPSASLLYLENDGGTGLTAGIVPGSSATVSNGQCMLYAPSSSYNVSGNTATLNVALSFTNSLPTNIYLYAASASGNSGWVQAGTWGVSAGPPTVVSVTPNAGTGASQTFSAVYSDPNGATDLATVRLLFNGTVNGAHACYLQYSPADNLLYLENDGNIGVSAGITPGSSATVSNSQCTLDAAPSSYNVSGNTATLNIALTFTSARPTNIYLYAGAASNSGWVQKGTWGVSAGTPTVVSVTPSAGAGTTQTFSAVYSDPNGATDLATVRLLFNGTANGAHACYLQYSPANNLLYLENDGNTGVSAGITPGSSATVSNSQCTLNAAGSSYNVSGNTAMLNVALTFTSTLPTNIYLYSGSASGSSGWVQKGTWGISAGAPTVVSVTPNAGAGTTQTFSAVYSDPNGAADLATVRLLFNGTVNGAHACYLQYNPADNLLYLENDGNTGVLAGITPGSSATVSNSQCTLNAAGSSYNVSGNTATLNVALTFTSTLPTNIYLYAGAAGNSGWVQKGTWGVSAGAPTVVSVTPNAGSGLTQTFSAVYSDPNGPADLETVRLLFNGAVNGAHACYLQYSPADNLLYLENDGNTGVSAGITPGSLVTVSNSQCTLDASGSSYSVSGNSAMLNVALTFTSALRTNIYLYAGAATNSGWVQKGTWGVSALISVAPKAGP